MSRSRKREPFAQIPHELQRCVYVAEGPSKGEPWLEVDVVWSPEWWPLQAPRVPLDVDGVGWARFGAPPFDDLYPAEMAPDWMRRWETTGWEWAEELLDSEPAT